MKAQEKMKFSIEKHHQDVQLQVADHVFLKLQPYRLRSLATRSNEKLRPQFYGPYDVFKHVGPVAYKLKLPTSGKIHFVFYVSQLKKQSGLTIVCHPLPKRLQEDLELRTYPKVVLDHCYFVNGDLELLIKQRELPNHDNSWEAYTRLKDIFPTLHLEDQVSFDGQGIVRAQVYVRKKNKKGAGETNGNGSRGRLGIHQVKSNTTYDNHLGVIQEGEESTGVYTRVPLQLKEGSSTSQQNGGTVIILKADVAAQEGRCEEGKNKHDKKGEGEEKKGREK